LLIFALFWGAATLTAQNTWTESSKTVTITNFTSGTLQTAIEAVLTSASKTLSDIQILSVSATPGNILNTTDVTYLQATSALKMNLQRLQLAGFTSIPDNTFKDYAGLSSASLSGVVVLGASAFENCIYLSSLTNVGSLTTVKDRAFYGCTRLSTGVNSLNLTTIGNYAFYRCTAITYANLSSVTSLGDGAFEGCSALAEVIFPSSKPNPLGDNAFNSNALDLMSVDFAWLETFLKTDTKVFLNQRPKVNIILTPPDRNVLLNADFNAIKPTVRFETPNGNTYSSIISQVPLPNWLAAGLTEPVDKVSYQGVERDDVWFQENLMKNPSPYLDPYIVLHSISTNNSSPFELTVSNFVTCDGASTKSTTSELTITFPVAVDNFTLNQISLSGGSAPSGSATPGTPVKVGGGTVWKVPVTNVVEGNVLVTISSSAYIGGGEQEIFLSKGPILWFNLEGGIMPESETTGLIFENEKWGKYVTFDQVVGTLPVPTRVGYTFAGWYSLPNDIMSYRYHSGSTYQQQGKEFTVYAVWEVRNYIITFNSNEGDAVTPPSITANYGIPIGALPVPIRPGYTFTEWNTLQDGTGDTYTATTSYTIDGDTTLFAQWEVKTYTLTFNSNDGDAVSPSSITVTYNKAIGNLPPNPTRSGYTFKSWNIKQDGSETTYDKTTIYQFVCDTTVYAQWEARTDLKINFNPNKGTVSPSSKAVVFDAPVGELPVPAFAGYKFMGWNTLLNGAGETYTETTKYTVNGDITLYAQWEERNDLTIYFDSNGGDEPAEEFSSKTVTYKFAVGTLPVPTFAGYKFTGWNIKQDGTGQTYTATTIYSIPNDTTLYAQWEANSYTITFNPNEGTVTPNKQEVTYNAEIGTMPIPVRTGYGFAGWNTSPDSAGEIYTATMLYQWTKDTVFYAQWRKLSENTEISDIDIVKGGEKTTYGDGLSSLCFLMECGENTITLAVTLEDDSTKIIYAGKEVKNIFDITFTEYGVIPVTLTVKAESGNTKDTTFFVMRRFPFDQVVITRWDNTMTVINNPLNNGGFHFDTFRWYEAANDAQPISELQYYWANDGHSLNPNKEYYVVLTADEFKGEIQTCNGKPAIKPQPKTNIYPNPVKANTTLSIETEEENADIEIYNVFGALLKSGKATDKINTLNLPYPAGMYLVKVNGQATTIIVE